MNRGADRGGDGWCDRWRRVAAGGAVVLGGAVGGCGGGAAGGDLEPADAFDAVIEATEQHTLVALGEFHLMQDWHHFMGELLDRPEFVANVDDLVVEFGNALYQDVADRFVVALEAVPFEELSQIWRNTIGGRVLWDAPIYEEFFRTVRRVNEDMIPERRVRVLLGDPDVDFARVHSAEDVAELDKGMDRDGFFADVVEREVLARGRHAVLIAGADHLRRGVHANTGTGDPNVATLLARDHGDELFIVYPLPFGYDEGVRREVESDLEDAPKPSLVHFRGTWLGAQEVSHRALEEGSTFEEQVDAVLWLGPQASLTASRPNPEIYRSGAYADELRRRSAILSEYFDEDIDYIEEGLELATAGPNL